MQEDEIILRRGIVHILDSALGYPVLSERELELTTDSRDFFRSHIARLFSEDDLKSCYFSEEDSEIYSLVQEFEEEQLVPFSKKIASALYAIMNANVAIPAGDLAVITFQRQSKRYLAFLKLNYKQSFVHMTQSEEEVGNVNQILCYQSTLPATGAKLSEAVLIDLEDYSVQLVEKKYEVNGSKVNYLSELFLHCHAKMSEKTRFSIVTRAVEQVNKKHYAQEPERQLEAKSVMQKELAESGTLDVKKLGETIYGTAPEIKEEFDAKMERYHMQDAQITPKSEKTVKKLEKQYLKTDTGIEINIPMEQYQDINQVEFITNADGTISVLIKNINQIMTK